MNEPDLPDSDAPPDTEEVTDPKVAGPPPPVDYERLDPQAVSLWRLQRVVRLATVGLPFAVAAGAGLGVFVSPILGGVVGTVIVLMQLVGATVWPSLEYRAFGYAVREHDLLVQSGVLFRHWSSIPLQRIQHVDTRQGPIERLLGLSRLQIYTAAGMSADGSIPALDEARAEELRDMLSRRGGDDGV